MSVKAELYELGAPDISGFPALDTDQTRLIVAAFGKSGPPVAAKRLTVKGREFPVTVELTVDDLAFPLTKVKRDIPRGNETKRIFLASVMMVFIVTTDVAVTAHVVIVRYTFVVLVVVVGVVVVSFCF